VPIAAYLQAFDHDPTALKPFPDDPHNRPAALFVSACCRGIAVAAGVLALTGCGAGGFSLEKADVDRSVITNSVSADQASGSGGIEADQVTIRNAVSSADVEEVAGKEIAWANADTGARGTITRLTEARRDGRLCRSFTGSRESFDGVAMFEGEACLAGQGAWRLETFKAL
jgi:surface antigen